MRYRILVTLRDKVARNKFKIDVGSRVLSDAASAGKVLLPVARVQLVDTYTFTAGRGMHEPAVANIYADVR